MKKDLERLTEWAVHKIETEYRDDVSLLAAVEGCSVNGDGHGEAFDYFIPATERGERLAQTFIIGGVGYDLYPRSWKRTMRTAELDDLATQCLADAKILYARSKEDEERFEALRQRLFRNLEDPGFVYRKALENLDSAMELYRTMLFEERLYRLRSLAGHICRFLAISAACLNHTYRRDSHNSFLREVSQWKVLPEGFTAYCEAIELARTAGELRSLCYALLASSRRFIARFRPERGLAGTRDFHALADWYQELRTWWNRLSFFCTSGQADMAFQEASQLQAELDCVGEEFGLGEMPLMDCFDAGNLEPLNRRAAALEQRILNTLKEHGVSVREYATLEAFLAAGR